MSYVFFLVDLTTRATNYSRTSSQDRCSSPRSTCTTTRSPTALFTSCTSATRLFDAALATVNVGKVNLGWASIGICEHSFYEAVTHAHNRILYGNRVTDFLHPPFADAYARLVAMKMFAARSTDYFRSASEDDRRFLLFNPITKAKVTRPRASASSTCSGM